MILYTLRNLDLELSQTWMQEYLFSGCILVQPLLGSQITEHKFLKPHGNFWMAAGQVHCCTWFLHHATLDQIRWQVRFISITGLQNLATTKTLTFQKVLQHSLISQKQEQARSQILNKFLGACPYQQCLVQSNSVLALLWVWDEVGLQCEPCYWPFCTVTSVDHIHCSTLFMDFSITYYL